jgi:hypothetical protein
MTSVVNIVIRDAHKGYNEFKHLKYKLIFGSGWYLTHLTDMNNGVDYSGYCGKFKQLFNGGQDFKKIHELANQGNIIIGVWKDTTGEPGHVVMVVPEREMEKGNWKISKERRACSLPMVMDTGRKARKKNERIRRLSLSFTEEMHEEVKFFMYIKR